MKYFLSVMVIVMFAFCGIMMYCLVDKIGGIKWDRQLPAVSCSTNVCNCANGCGTRQANGEMTNKDALEILRNEQTNWLAVIGFFGVIFGLVVPVGSYLLQRQSLKDERDQIREELKDHRVQISRKIRKMTHKTRLDLAQIKKEADAHMNEILEDQKNLMCNQVTAAILNIESSINFCKGDNWKYEWTRRHEIISELIFVLALFRRVDDRGYVKGRLKRVAEILREFGVAIQADVKWHVKNEAQTSAVRFDELKWFENECKDDYKIVQGVLHVLGIHVLD